MEDVEMYIKEQKLKSNLLYCIIIKKSDYLEKEFDKDISTYLVDGDGDHVAGTDVENETIYLLYIEEWKIFKMIDFFKKHDVLLKFEIVTNIFDFLGNLKYSSIYSDKDNKKIIDTYISIHITMDDVLDFRIQITSHRKRNSLNGIKKQAITRLLFRG